MSTRGHARKKSSADSPPPALKGSSKYRGVSWNSNCNKWRAQVSALSASQTLLVKLDYRATWLASLDRFSRTGAGSVLLHTPQKTVQQDLDASQ